MINLKTGINSIGKISFYQYKSPLFTDNRCAI